MSDSLSDDAIAGLDLTADEYTVEQSLVRNKYAVYDPDGNLVLRAKQKLFKMKEEFPFVDANDDPVFTVKASGILDIAGDYALVDDRTGEKVLVLGKNFTLLKHSWTLRDPDTNDVVAEIRSGSRLLELLRGLSTLFSFLPHNYTISAPDGREVGEISGQFSVRDRYAIRVWDDDVPREAVVAGAIAIDALEGN